MFRYLFFCALLAPELLGSPSRRSLRLFQCDNYNKTIDQGDTNRILVSKVCDGKKDCSDGSDEFLAHCKFHPSSPEYNSDSFYCASGSEIDDNYVCNGVDDCWDKSDETLFNCNVTEAHKMIESQKGKCSQGEWQCIDGKCISITQLCDDNIDCSNGGDEALAVCYTTCEEDDFQCGNGACIPNKMVCDNIYNCLDGADELPNVCGDIEGYKPSNAYRRCNDTIQKPNAAWPAFFADDFNYHVDANGRKYVLPNEPVRLNCPHWRRLEGQEWNICMLNGTWHHDFPLCVRPGKAIGNNRHLKS